MQLRRDLLAATDRSESILRSLPTHFTGAIGATLPALVLLDFTRPDAGEDLLETMANALVLLEYIDRVLEVDPPLIASSLVRRLHPDVRLLRSDAVVRLTERGRALVLASRRSADGVRQAVGS